MFAQWASDEFTLRIHNRTVADVDPLIDIRLVGLLEGVSIQNVTLSLDNAAPNDKDLPLYRDMTESREPILTPGLRSPQCRSVCATHRARTVPAACNSHSKLTADIAKWCVVYAKRAAIALGPDQTLWAGWHHFAMLAQNLAVRVNVKQRVIKAPVAGLGITCVHPYSYVCTGLLSWTNLDIANVILIAASIDIRDSGCRSGSPDRATR